MLRCNATAQGRLLGTDNPYSSITDDQVNEIRRLRAEGFTYQTIARQVGCCLASAQKIAVGTLRAQTPARTLHRLTREDAPEVSRLHAEGNGYENIAKALGVTRSSARIALLDVKACRQGKP